MVVWQSWWLHKVKANELGVMVVGWLGGDLVAEFEAYRVGSRYSSFPPLHRHNPGRGLSCYTGSTEPSLSLLGFHVISRELDLEVDVVHGCFTEGSDSIPGIVSWELDALANEAATQV